jgi:hypothetical protein
VQRASRPSEQSAGTIRLRPGRFVAGALFATAAASLLVGSALARGSSSFGAPTSSFAGHPSSGGLPSSSFTGSGTSGGSGEGDGRGSDDSGPGNGDGGGNGTLGAAPRADSGVVGMDASAVRRLQADLARLGFFHHVVTGFYGSVTTAAVKRFQRSVGLKPDGIWGPLSRSALRRQLTGA